MEGAKNASDFDMVNMGESALKSHMKGKGHKAAARAGTSSTVHDFFSTTTSKASAATSQPAAQSNHQVKKRFKHELVLCIATCKWRKELAS